MDILFIGLGSIGMRHARLIRQEFPAFGLYALRSSTGASPNALGIPEVHDWSAVARIAPSVAFVCVPTHLHMDVALRCVDMGMHVFLEKPIAADTEKLDTLVGAVRARGLCAYVAYCLRFHPVIQYLKALLTHDVTVHHARAICATYLPGWRPGRDHLDTYSAHWAQGGGAILELSHEFDYARYLVGPVTGITGAVGQAAPGVTVDAEDWADALASHASGAHSNIHVNLFSQSNQRMIELDTSEGYIRGDMVCSTVERLHGQKRETIDLHDDRDHMYIAQLHHFFAHVLEGAPLMNSIEDASDLFRQIVTFRNRARGRA
jgi:predicted dehydrogenase